VKPIPVPIWVPLFAPKADQARLDITVMTDGMAWKAKRGTRSRDPIHRGIAQQKRRSSRLQRRDTRPPAGVERWRAKPRIRLC